MKADHREEGGSTEGAGEGKTGGPVEPGRPGIAEQGPMRLPAEPFDRFAELLEASPPPEFEALRDRETRWSR